MRETRATLAPFRSRRVPLSPESESAAPAAVAELDPVEGRILGCLIEKAAITPEVYPLTVNAIVAACNQKTSRDPVMHLEMGAVANALRHMEERGLVKVAPASQRALRYEHRFDTAYGVTARQRAVLCALLLRGAQTLNEIATRTERLADFPAIDDVRDSLDRLIQREPALVVRIPRGAGQREDRYMHLLGGPVDIAAIAQASTAHGEPLAMSGIEDRLSALENEIVALKQELTALRSRIGGGGPA